MSLPHAGPDAQHSVAIAQRTYGLADESFRRGLTDYVNVLGSQTQLLQARQQLAKVQAEQLITHVSLVTALGGGLGGPSSGPADETLVPAQHISPFKQLHSIHQSDIR
jgi:hypothetical protein